MHQHVFQRCASVTLTLPDFDGRYALYSGFQCACGATDSCLSWAKPTGRHLTYTELRAVQARERKVRSLPGREQR